MAKKKKPLPGHQCTRFTSVKGLTQKQRDFLNAYATRPNATAAAWLVGVHRNTVYTVWLKRKRFQECFEEAWQWHLDECRATLVGAGQISADYAERVLNRWEARQQEGSGPELSIVIEDDEKIVRIGQASIEDAQAK